MNVLEATEVQRTSKIFFEVIIKLFTDKLNVTVISGKLEVTSKMDSGHVYYSGKNGYMYFTDTGSEKCKLQISHGSFKREGKCEFYEVFPCFSVYFLFIEFNRLILT